MINIIKRKFAILSSAKNMKKIQMTTRNSNIIYYIIKGFHYDNNVGSIIKENTFQL